ncbi:MAG: hypothetical protein M0P12_03085 [Paludibacteraceae bacterium]|nr:hypothetical protein [Paludibacteraceae bacterium]
MVVEDVIVLAESIGWKLEERHEASTLTTYLDFSRQRETEKEWIVIRVGDHKHFYPSWVTMYSVSPGDLWFEELPDILQRPFGNVGDIL